MPKAKFKSIISTRRRAKKARMETTEPTVQPGQVLASVSEPQATPATNVPGTSAHVELPSLVLSTASQTAPSTNVTVTQPQTAMVSGSANQVQPEMNAIAPIDVATSSKECDGGKYGQDCLLKCGACLGYKQCHHINGSCIEGCDAEFKGAFCDKACSRGKFGYNCEQDYNENCDDPLKCNRTTGVCEGGCQPGWKGPQCTNDGTLKTEPPFPRQALSQ